MICKEENCDFENENYFCGMGDYDKQECPKCGAKYLDRVPVLCESARVVDERFSRIPD
jgi:hypothetical protein